MQAAELSLDMWDCEPATSGSSVPDATVVRLAQETEVVVRIACIGRSGKRRRCALASLTSKDLQPLLCCRLFETKSST